MSTALYVDAGIQASKVRIVRNCLKGSLIDSFMIHSVLQWFGLLSIILNILD
jgi:hypothetical protein